VNAAKTLFAVLVLGAVGAGGYFWGSRAPMATGAQADAAAAAATAAASAPSAPRKLLYYRNPMGLPDTSTTPKKDQMGMDYIAVYEGEDDSSGEPSTAAAGSVRISTEKVQKLGVRTAAASMQPLGRTLRLAGRVEPDERRVFMIAPKFEGYVERLHVNATGQAVAKGQALFEVYSPEMVSAQREYVIALQGLKEMQGAGTEAQAGMKQLADASLARLRNWDLSAEQMAALVKTGEVRRTVAFGSPVSGTVTEKKAVQGMRFMPGEPLYQVTDLSAVWVMADVPEQDLALVKTGAKASVRLNAYPAQSFAGVITTVYPTLNAETRTVPVRIELANPRQLFKPAMFAQVELQVGSAKPVLTVPDSAVIDTGTRRMVLVQRAEGRFEPREVKLGARSDALVEVLQGLQEGEQVVVAANFLIDAESNLKAAIGGMAAPAAAGAAASVPATATPAAPKAAGVSHKAVGSVESVDAKAGTVTLNHGAVESLKWPAMTMDFVLANTALLQGLKPGAPVAFEFVERKPGEWVITAIKVTAAAPPARPSAPASAPAAAKPHSGH
jgi:Cu(I)/Ag(I) efflux system membrane fusion protein